MYLHIIYRTHVWSMSPHLFSCSLMNAVWLCRGETKQNSLKARSFEQHEWICRPMVSSGNNLLCSSCGINWCSCSAGICRQYTDRTRRKPINSPIHHCPLAQSSQFSSGSSGLICLIPCIVSARASATGSLVFFVLRSSFFIPRSSFLASRSCLPSHRRLLHSHAHTHARTWKHMLMGCLFEEQ